MSASPLTHEAILASAGSGKTHALVTRYLRLMACGQPPDRIIALTFTRKAAGEFFDKILQRLAGAAASGHARSQLAENLEIADPGRDRVVAWLRLIVERLPFLTLGTLDSFFIRIITAFPLEFGLGGPFQLLEGADIARERAELCRLVFQRVPADRRHEQDGFLAAFELATFGLEEKSLHRAFDRFIDDHHLAWLLDPVPDKWGHATQVWGQIPWYFECAQSDPLELQQQFVKAIDGLGLQSRQREKLQVIANQLAQHDPGRPNAKELEYFRKNILPGIEDMRTGTAVVKIWSSIKLPEAACRPLARLIGRMLAREAATLLRRTQGLAAVLADYESHHESVVRREGRLTFDDVKWLLARGGPAGNAGTDKAGTDKAVRARLHLEERLDARFDHWLIDEFQDTSLLQWEVMRPLVEEALEDPEGRRTYFQVGDEKQSIYRWRGGEPDLGRHIIERYQLRTRPLATSWRSSPPVIDAVNAVFGNQTAMAAVVPASTAERWACGWTEHTTQLSDRGGFAALLRPADESEPDPDRLPLEREMEVVAAFLREIRPVDRGLSAAILMRSNEDVAAAVDFLRGQGDLPPVVSETDATVAVDNPVTLALLSLLRAAAHPGDTMAWEHVQMTPLRAGWVETEWSRGHLVRHTLRWVVERGFEAWVRWWMARLDPVLSPEDSFSRLRLKQLAELGQSFDARLSRDIDDFLQVVSSSTAGEAACVGSIQVMTVHKSKGLDFDIVFLPRLAGRSFHDDSRRLLLRQRNEDFSTRWVLRRPPAELMIADATLRDAHAASQAAQAYEGLCVLYVAMTRARYALYMVVDPASGSGSAHHAAAFVERALAPDGAPDAGRVEAAGRLWSCGWRAGDARWFESWAMEKCLPPAAAKTVPEAPYRPLASGSRRRIRLTPSGRESRELTASQLFSMAASPARELGVLVHSMFERVGDPGDRSALRAWWAAEFPHPMPWEEAAHQQVMACLDAPEVARVLSIRPGASLWREKRFEIILDDQWVTGTIDRVQMGPGEATIVDFKSDEVADLAAARERAHVYRPQIALYRRVVSRLTGLDEHTIRSALVFTRLCRVVSLD